MALFPMRLKQPYSLYNPGEIAGFPADICEKLMEAGVAEPYEQEDAAPEADPAASAADGKKK